MTFPPEECLSPTREKRERSCDSSRPAEEERRDEKEETPPNTVNAPQLEVVSSSPMRGAVKEGREGLEMPRSTAPPVNKLNRFQVSRNALKEQEKAMTCAKWSDSPTPPVCIDVRDVLSNLPFLLSVCADLTSG